MSKTIQYLKVHHLHPHKSVRSPLITSLSLGIIRSIWLLFCISAVISRLIINAPTPLSYILYLTNLSFYGLTAYMLVSTYITWRYIFNPDYIPWDNLHWLFKFGYFLLYEMNLILSVIVTIIYWSILAKPAFAANPSSFTLYIEISMHAFNTIICISEGILSFNPVILSHLPIIIIIALLYLPYAILLHYIYNKWAYFFLDYTQYPVYFAGIIVGTVIASIILHLIYYKLHQLKYQRWKLNDPDTSTPMNQIVTT